MSKKTFICIYFILLACGLVGCGNNSNNTSRSWRGATLLETENSGEAIVPQVAIDASGNALAVWFQSDGTRYNIWSNRYAVSTKTWGSPTLIETDDTGDALFPQIAMNASGNAIAVWYQSSNSSYKIYSNRYTASTGTWNTAEQIESNDSADAYIPRVAMDAFDNALVVWYQNDSAQPPSIWANRYTDNTGTW